jgi:GxxExxY protein
MAIPEPYESVTNKIIGAAMRVHSQLVPGLLESVYEACLAYELGKRGLTVERQKSVPVVYEDMRLEGGFRLDLLVQDLIIVEVKSVEALAPIHSSQVLTYLKLSGLKVGLLIDFNVEHLRTNIKRILHDI